MIVSQEAMHILIFLSFLQLKMTEKYQPFITLCFDNVQYSISAKSTGTLQTATPTCIESAVPVKSATTVQSTVPVKSTTPIQSTVPAAPVAPAAHVAPAAQVESTVRSSIKELIEDDIEDQPGIKDDTEDQPELPKDVRIGLSYKAWKDANGQLSMRKAARIFRISWTTLQGHINGAVSKAEACQERQ